MATREPGEARPVVTGLERECLRQAVHDLRNRLNATSLLLHVAMAAAAKDDSDAAAGKLSQAVRELQTVSRLLDQLVATSDTFALEIVPIDLGAAVADASRASAASDTGVRVHVAMPDTPNVVISCPSRLPRMLAMILERCIAALPDGGDVRFAADASPVQTRLSALASGPRVVAPLPGKAFEMADGTVPGGGWFALRAFARGLRGDVRVMQEGSGAMRIEIELPRNVSDSGVSDSGVSGSGVSGSGVSGSSVSGTSPVTPSTH